MQFREGVIMNYEEITENEIFKTCVEIGIPIIILIGAISITALSSYKLGKISGAEMMIDAVSNVYEIPVSELLGKISILETVGIKL